MNALGRYRGTTGERRTPFGDIPEARRMHVSIPGSRLEIFGECGHWPQHEHAIRFNALTREFLSA